MYLCGSYDFQNELFIHQNSINRAFVLTETHYLCWEVNFYNFLKELHSSGHSYTQLSNIIRILWLTTHPADATCSCWTQY
jgi:hypothetical protein